MSKFIIVTHLDLAAKHMGVKRGGLYMVRSETRKCSNVKNGMVKIYVIDSPYGDNRQTLISEGHCMVFSGEEARLATLLYEI